MKIKFFLSTLILSIFFVQNISLSSEIYQIKNKLTKNNISNSDKPLIINPITNDPNYDATSEFKKFLAEYNKIIYIVNEDEYKKQAEPLLAKGESILINVIGGLTTSNAVTLADNLSKMKERITFGYGNPQIPPTFKRDYLKELNENVLIPNYVYAIYTTIIYYSPGQIYSKEAYEYTQTIKKRILMNLKFPENLDLLQKSMYSATYGVNIIDINDENYLSESQKDTELYLEIAKSNLTPTQYNDNILTIKFDITIQMYAKYKKFISAVNEIDTFLKLCPKKDNRYSLALKKRAEYLALINENSILEFSDEITQQVFVNENDEPEIKIKIKNFPEQVTEIVVKLHYEYDQEKAQSIDKYLTQEQITPRRYLTDKDSKEKKIGFVIGDKIEQEITLVFNSNTPEQTFKFRTTSYCTDKFKIIATANLNTSNNIAIKELEVWRKYSLRLYHMKDPSELDLSTSTEGAVKVFNDHCILFIPELKNANIPHKRYIAIDNKPDPNNEIALVMYIENLVAEGIEFKKQNEFINIIGADYLNALDSDNPENTSSVQITGYSDGLIWNQYPFYSVILANGYITNLMLSKTKVLVHELGHRLGLKHEISGNCFMITGDIANPLFCEKCQKTIMNNPLFVNDK